MSKSVSDINYPKLLKLASSETSNSSSPLAHQTYNSLLLDSGLSALASATSLLEQESLRREQAFDSEKLSQSLTIESLDAIFRNAAKRNSKLAEGSVGSSPIDQRSHSNSPNVFPTGTASGGHQNAIIALQASQNETGASATAILASEDLQHLLSNGVGSSSGTNSGEQQFFILVPPDVPVLVPPASSAQPQSSPNEPADPWMAKRRNSTAVHYNHDSSATAAAVLSQQANSIASSVVSKSLLPPPSSQQQRSWNHGAAVSIAAYLAQQQQPAARRASVIGTVHERLAAAAVAEQVNPVAAANFSEEFLNETRNIRRRVSHNEVERRRRDRINTWIGELQKLLPADEQAKSHYQSKGLVLKRVWEYFQNVDSMLKNTNAAAQEIQQENSNLKHRLAQLEQENQLLRSMTNLGAASTAPAAEPANPEPPPPVFVQEQTEPDEQMGVLAKKRRFSSIEQPSISPNTTGP